MHLTTYLAIADISLVDTLRLISAGKLALRVTVSYRLPQSAVLELNIIYADITAPASSVCGLDDQTEIVLSTNVHRSLAERKILPIVNLQIVVACHCIANSQSHVVLLPHSIYVL